MAKSDEKKYFKLIGDDVLASTLKKPFSDSVNIGGLLSDIGAIFTLLPNPPARLLDLGCGLGWTSNFYAQAGYDVLGVDISKDAITAAQKHFADKRKSLQFEYGDYESMKHDNGFDAAVFFDSLHHADSEFKALAAAYKALKSGGTIVVCEPGTGHSKSPSSIEAVERYGVSERDMPPKLSKKALLSVGFRNIKTYAYPAHMHRINYKSFSDSKKFINNSVTRGSIAFALATFLKPNHGILVATK